MADYHSENAAARARLHSFADRFAPQRLGFRLHNGWKVAAAFVHLAFWDFYSQALLRNWKKGLVPSKSANIDATNAGVTALSRNIPPAAAAALALEAAEAVDREVESLAPELGAMIAASEHQFLLFRAWHRNEHLKTMESELS